MPGALRRRQRPQKQSENSRRLGFGSGRRRVCGGRLSILRSSCFANTDTKTPGSTILCTELEISQPTLFRYFPTKDAVLREVGERGYACICERLRRELSSKAGTDERLRRLY